VTPTRLHAPAAAKTTGALQLHMCDDWLCAADSHTFTSLAMRSCMLLLMWAHMLQLTHTPRGKQAHYKPTHSTFTSWLLNTHLELGLHRLGHGYPLFCCLLGGSNGSLRLLLVEPSPY
jgi:hypothetical protein